MPHLQSFTHPPCTDSQSRHVPDLRKAAGTGAIPVSLYVVEGIDPAGRKFRGLYSEQDALELQASNPRLNIIIAKREQRVVKSDIN